MLFMFFSILRVKWGEVLCVKNVKNYFKSFKMFSAYLFKKENQIFKILIGYYEGGKKSTNLPRT